MGEIPGEVESIRRPGLWYDEASVKSHQKIRLALLVRLKLGAHVLGQLGPPILIVFAYTLLATFIVRWDVSRSGSPLPDFGSTLYGLYTQVFFEPTDPLPPTTVARILFWFTPLVGALLIAEGFVKVGGALLDREAWHQLWVKFMSNSLHEHVVVCGIGNVGYRVIEELCELGEDVVAIERDHSDFVERIRARGVPVHVGDARRDDLLEAMGVARARAIVCATDDDLANLEIALDAKRMQPKIRVLMRMFDQRLAAKVGGALELDQSFSTSALSAPLIALSAIQPGVKSVYRLGSHQRATCEVTLQVKASGRSVRELERELGCRIVSLKKGSAYVSATEESRLEPGTTFVLDADAAELDAIIDKLP